MTIITIMPDFGGAWTWRREDKATKGIGPCIAGPGRGGPGDVPGELLKRFGDWQRTYQADFDKDGFDLKGSRAEGVALSREIRRYIPGEFPLFYREPSKGVFYDPDDRTVSMEILADGTLKPLK